MQKTAEQLQRDLDRAEDYAREVNDRIEQLREQLKNSISPAEYERRIADLKREYEWKLLKITSQPSRVLNWRGSGRKRIASKETVNKVLELRRQGLSQAKIAAKLSGEHNIKIGATTVGEIVRGTYTPLDEKSPLFPTGLSPPKAVKTP